MALSGVHNVLTSANWEGARLDELLALELSPYGAARYRLDGPPVTLTAQEALTFALVTHELATNAAKYGALSLPDGCVRVTWGLARDAAMPETEDHLAYLCEVMRYLIAGDDVTVSNLTRQREFFAGHLQPWAPALCDAVAGHPRAHFYARLADFTRAFLSVEQQGFDMLA